MSTTNTPASSNDDETTPAETTTGALEWHAPVLVRVDEHTTIPRLLKERVQRGATRPLILRKVGMGDTWRPVTAREFYDEVQSVAAGLIARGLKPGGRVAIMSRTRYEWTLLDFACWAAALIPVPIYETSSIDQVAHVLTDADVDLVVTETVSMAEIVRTAAEREGRDNTEVLSLDSEAIDTLIAEGATTPRDRVVARSEALTKDDISTIVYTSGTTGTPKGTVLSHENFTNLCLNAHAWMPEIAAGATSRLLLFLPLAHVFARFLQVFQISGNGVMGHAPNIKNLLPDLASFRPSYLLVVPRVLEKIYNSADTKSRGPKRKVFRWAAKVAIDYSRALDTDEGPSASLKAQHALADKLVYQQIIRLVGGNADYIISGGAPLATWLAHFYRGVGIPVLEGYGLTETVGPVSVNTPRLSKIGTVGPALPPMSFKISDDGEILLKGSSVFQGYNNDPEATAACFTDDGWFRTGDLGSLDRDGYVSITGRAKDIIVTAGGKNVAPASLENPMRSHPLISQVLVVGDQRPFVAAL
ncbi:MAG: AMP-dependent synthetase/ligase, partial [Pauljensenia sp.]